MYAGVLPVAEKWLHLPDKAYTICFSAYEMLKYTTEYFKNYRKGSLFVMPKIILWQKPAVNKTGDMINL